jgi:hypothetical protein
MFGRDVVSGESGAEAACPPSVSEVLELALDDIGA